MFSDFTNNSIISNDFHKSIMHLFYSNKEYAIQDILQFNIIICAIFFSKHILHIIVLGELGTQV